MQDVLGELDSPARTNMSPAPTNMSPAPTNMPTSSGSTPVSSAASSPTQRSIISPIAADRFLVKITVGRETQQTLEQLRALLRHQIPSGDPAEIISRALTLYLDQTLRDRCAARRTSSNHRFHQKPGGKRSPAPSARHIPASIRRAVWDRDEGRCAFIGPDGRCGESGFLEIHHVIPFASGGPATLANLELRCRAHNAFEAFLQFGESRAGQGGR